MKNVWLLVLACICMTACRNRQQSAEVTNYDLPQIKDSGELVVLTLNSSTSYFDYRRVLWEFLPVKNRIRKRV